MKDTVLVTGGGGFIGAHVTRKLLGMGRRVRVLDKFLYGRAGLKDMIGRPDLELVEGDISDRATVRRAVRGVDSVIALAALVGDAACELHPEMTMAVNYFATRDLIDGCREEDVRRIVFASSCSVYGANGNSALSETSHINPVSLYARTRVLSEEILVHAASEIEVAILRLATVCGTSPRMRFDLMINTMTAFAYTEGRIRVTGASQWRPHLHIQDAAEAFIAACDAPVASGSVFNVGTDEQNFTIGEVAEMVAAHVPGTRVEYAEDLSDRRSYRCSFEKIHREMGFHPKRTVVNAVEEVKGLLETGGVDDFRASRFHNVKFLGATVGGGNGARECRL